MTEPLNIYIWEDGAVVIAPTRAMAQFLLGRPVDNSEAPGVQPMRVVPLKRGAGSRMVVLPPRNVDKPEGS